MTEVQKQLAWGLLGALAWANGCDPSGPHQPNKPGEIDPPIETGGASSELFEAGPIDEDDLETARSASCVTSTTEPSPAPSAIEFIVDVSGSMALAPDLDTTSKWTTTRRALSEATTAIHETTRVGAVFFPGKPTDRHCTTPEGECEPAKPRSRDECINLDAIVEPEVIGPDGSDFRVAFEEALLDINPAGGTPTHDALLQALDELSEAPDSGERFLVLITDGQPTFLEGCTGSGNVNHPVSEEPIVEAIRNAREDGIRTFIVGAPGSQETTGAGEDARPWLSRAAIAGFTGSEGCTEEGPNYCHFDLTESSDFPRDLTAALSKILGQIKSCDIQLPDELHKEELDPDRLNVVVHSGEESSFVIGQESDECVDGWMMSDERDQLTLCPLACDYHRASAMSHVELFVGCPAAPVIVPR